MAFNVFKPTLIASILIALSACGGGGQNSAATSTQVSSSSLAESSNNAASSGISKNKISQTISFEQSNIVSDLEYRSGKTTTITNPLNVLGTGSITYESSNTKIASVDSDGTVTVYSELSGSVTITATIAADEKYQAASASYIIHVKNNNTVSLAPADITMTAWIGKKDALITFPQTANGFTFYSTNSSDCDYTHVANCINGQFVLLNGSTITDTATTLNQPGYYLLKDSNDHSSFRMLSNATFSPRAEHQVVNYNNSLLLIGGYLGIQNFESPELKNDVWSSIDGISWIEQTEHAGFSPRTGQKVVSFNNTLWLIGGNDRTVDYLIPGDDNGRKNDIWSSADGVIWTQQISKASFSPRTGHELISFNNKLWVIGGDDKNGLKNDIWSSTNGITWIRQTANANFSPRADHQVVAYNNKLWLIGGSNNNDVWSSTDGINWTQQTANTNFEARSGYQVAVFANKLWVIGGYNNSGYKNDVWSSTDGITWTQQTEHAAFTPSGNFQLINFNDRLLLIGGYTQDGFSSDVWSTTDGIEWRKGFSATFQFPQ